MEVRSQIDYNEAFWRNNCLALGNEMGVKVIDNAVKIGYKCKFEALMENSIMQIMHIINMFRLVFRLRNTNLTLDNTLKIR